jgi:hypothetical protein
MTEEIFNEFVDSYIEEMKADLIDSGGIVPAISILGEDIEEDKPSVAFIPVPNDVLKDEEYKVIFVNKVLPEVYEKIKEHCVPKVVIWASEAWMRFADKDIDIKNQDWKQLPIKKEVLIITKATETAEDVNMFEIVRDGQKVNEDGKLIDAITLKELPDLKEMTGFGGTFSGLYKKLKSKDEDNDSETN